MASHAHLSLVTTPRVLLHPFQRGGTESHGVTQPAQGLNGHEQHRWDLNSAPPCSAYIHKVWDRKWPR